eukprot:m.2087 g.2087  ORF g.2087 m.2087 type:complete len:267 (+) comp1716_c0_seq1:203-1003(+)
MSITFCSKVVVVGMLVFITLILMGSIVDVVEAKWMEGMDYYSILDVPKDASKKDIKRAFRKFALIYHPDKNPSEDAQEQFITIATAYETLSDDTLRKQYDASGFASHQHHGQQQQHQHRAQDFDYNAFYKRFDEELRKHAKAHMDALRQAGFNGLDEVAEHLREHLRLHAKQQKQAAREAHRIHHQHAQYSESRTDLLLDDLFDDVEDDEEDEWNAFVQQVEEKNNSHPNQNKDSSTTRSCSTKVIEKDGKVETVTECTEVTNHST